MSESKDKFHPSCSTDPGSNLGEVKSAPSSPGTSWIAGSIETPAGSVPKIACELTISDRLGAWKVRWGIGRMRYRVSPGLYAVGNPSDESPALVTANYKLTFDRVRSHLAGIDAWLVVLETSGINVWCAAGGGKFVTDELISRLETVRLKEVVSHRTLILPQLSAPGVSAHEVGRRSAFKVIYGPVRAEDILPFLNGGMKATGEMRRVTFELPERAVLIPIELVTAGKYFLPAALVLFVLSGIGRGGYSLHRAATEGGFTVWVFLLAFLCGVILAPLLLPWLPGRAFSVKGAFLGVVLSGVYALIIRFPLDTPLVGAAAFSWFLVIPAVTSFLLMNFTGSSTYTSLSGVRREIRFALPVQAVLAFLGLLLWVAGRFV